MPSVGEPGYLPYCGPCPGLVRMKRGKDAFECSRCGLKTRNVNGEDMFDRTAPVEPLFRQFARALAYETLFQRNQASGGILVSRQFVAESVHYAVAAARLMGQLP